MNRLPNLPFVSCFVHLFLVLVKGEVIVNASKKNPIELPVYPNLIVNGTVTRPHEYPFMVRLMKKHGYSESWSHSCGGSLYDRYHVITAAHCVDDNPEYLLAVFGDHCRFKWDLRQKSIRVEKIHVHEDWDLKTKADDIAVLKLEQPVKLSKNVQTISLATKEVDGGEMLTVMGWGVNENDDIELCLNKAEVPVVPLDTCNKWHEGLPYFPTITENMICAGYMQGGVDSCQGDSGGPLVRPVGGDRYELQGIVSFGYYCALPKRPGVYTNVYNYKEWIKATVKI